MLIDSFLFCPLPEEVPKCLDILEKRIKELDSIVDFFVIVERSPFPFRNSDRKRFTPFMKKIVHVGVFKEKPVNHPRDYILSGLYHLRVKPEDTVILSECNSIPDLNKLKESLTFLSDYLILKTEGKNFITQELIGIEDSILLIKGINAEQRHSSIIVAMGGIDGSKINEKTINNVGFTYV